MENYAKPTKPNKERVISLLLGLLVEVLAFGVCMVLFRVSVYHGKLLQDIKDVAGEETAPTVGRLIYFFVSLCLGIAAFFVSNFFDKKEKSLLSFAFAFGSGVFFWQAFGETIWHFSAGGVNFVRIESVQSFPIPIVFAALLIALGFVKNKNFAIWVMLLSFACNWFGHYITIGFYPFLEPKVSWKIWANSISGVFGGLSVLLGFFLSLFCSKNKKAVYVSSMLIFIGLGVLYYGCINLETM